MRHFRRKKHVNSNIKSNSKNEIDFQERINSKKGRIEA